MQIKKRFVWWNVVLCFITLGIYSFYWIYTLTEDSNKISPEYATASGAKAVVLTISTFGIYGYYWHYKLGLKTYKQFESGFMELVFYIIGLGFLNLILCQTEVNTYADVPNDVPSKRNVAASVILSIVTLGVYFTYWRLRLTEECARISSEPKLPNADLCETFSVISLGFYRIYWSYRLAQKLKLNAPLCAVLSLFAGVVALALAQNEINKSHAVEKI